MLIGWLAHVAIYAKYVSAFLLAQVECVAHLVKQLANCDLRALPFNWSLVTHNVTELRATLQHRSFPSIHCEEPLVYERMTPIAWKPLEMARNRRLELIMRARILSLRGEIHTVYNYIPLRLEILSENMVF